VAYDLVSLLATSCTSNGQSSPKIEASSANSSNPSISIDPTYFIKENLAKEITKQDCTLSDGTKWAEKAIADGRTYNYAYRLTREYPHTLACFSGQLLSETR
jgi:hypothetical protein